MLNPKLFISLGKVTTIGINVLKFGKKEKGTL